MFFVNAGPKGRKKAEKGARAGPATTGAKPHPRRRFSANQRAEREGSTPPPDHFCTLTGWHQIRTPRPKTNAVEAVPFTAENKFCNTARRRARRAIHTKT